MRGDKRTRNQLLGGMHASQHGRVDGDAGLDAARQARRGRQFGNVVERQMPCDRAHAGLVDGRLDERMAHCMVARRVEARAILAEIVEIGAGDDLRVRRGPDRAVQAGLAVEAAVHRIRAVLVTWRTRRRR